MAQHPLIVSEERFIAAPPEKIFDVLADPAQHAAIDGSGTVQHARSGGPRRLSLGAKFGMSMRIGVPYRISNTVVEFEEGRLIAWRHFGGHVWRYELEPREGGTLVRETVDYSRSHSQLYVKLAGWVPRSRRAIEQTLARLEQHVT